MQNFPSRFLDKITIKVFKSSIINGIYILMISEQRSSSILVE
jgi:hypothetical protein